MKKDIGFWNQQGEYIQDIQEINKMDMDKYFEELNDMANFKNFGESKEEEITIDGVDVAGCEYCEDCSFCKGCFKLQQENAELKAENERLKAEIKEVKKYQYEQEFLEKEIEEQREKNKRLTCKILEVKALNETLNVQCTSQDCTQLRKLHQTLQEIKAIAECIINNEDKPACVNDKECPLNGGDGFDNHCNIRCPFILGKQILDLITKAEEE